MIEETNEISVREILLYSIVMTFLLLLFGSCSRYTPTKAVEQINKANNTYPGTVAELTRKWYPCITRSSDTVVLTKDSVIYIECPDLPEVIDGGRVDTFIIENVKTKTVRVPVTIPVRTQVVTKYIEDSAKIKVLTAAYDGAVKLLEKEKEKYAEMKQARNKWRKWCLITWGIIVLAIFLRIALPKIPFLK